MLVLASLTFLAVGCAALALVLWFAPRRLDARVQAVAGVQADPGWQQAVLRMAGPLARLSTPSGDWSSSPLRLRFLHAGIRNEHAHLAYFAAKSTLPLLFAGGAFLLLRTWHPSTGGVALLFWLALAALAGTWAPNLALTVAVRARQREVFEAFPDAADLMLVCVEAGLGLDAALARVAEEMQRRSAALAQELQLANLEMRAGASREQALRNLALRTGVEEIQTFVAMLAQADRFGTSIGDSLRVFSEELRHKRQVRAEEAAAKVPTKLLFPLVLCIFPSIIMVILGPAVIQVVRTLLPMLSRGGG